MKYILLSIWFIYLLIFPFQIFPPGSLQLADYVMLLGVLLLFLKKIVIDNYIKISSIFVLYTLVVSILYAVFYHKFQFLIYSLNYIYCFTCLLFITNIFNNTNFIKVTVWAILFSLLVQLIVFKAKGLNLDQFRFTLMFNNPNQLGFWALNYLLLSTLFLLIERSAYKKILIFSIVLELFYIVLSISQAAIISALFIIVIIVISTFRKKIAVSFFVLLFLSTSIFLLKEKFSDIQVITNVQDRITKEIEEDDGDNNLDGRNYTRLTKYPQYLIFGAGEGLYERFGNELEIHSTLANVLFSYGFLGFILFLIPYSFITPKIFSNLTFLVVAYFIFTLVHNTIRWPLYWIVPYLVYKISAINNKGLSYVRN